MFLEILQNSRENACARVSFLITLQASGCVTSNQTMLPVILFYFFLVLKVSGPNKVNVGLRLKVSQFDISK